MPANKLISAVKSVDWLGNIESFSDDLPAVESLAKSGLRLAVWSRQLEIIDKGNPALSFVREMQVNNQLVAVSTSLGLYRSAASAMRSMVETALYYTYFRVHPVELVTLVKNPKYFIAKADVIEYHNLHSHDFSRLQSRIGLVSDLNPWYSSISAIVHGQIPGKWNQQTSISSIKYDADLKRTVIDNFTVAEEIVHRLFLCTVAQEMWEVFSSTAKKSLISGLSGDLKKDFGLDSA